MGNMCLHLPVPCTDVVETLLEPGINAFAVSGQCWLD